MHVPLAWLGQYHSNSILNNGTSLSHPPPLFTLGNYMNKKLVELYESKWNNYYKELKNVTGKEKPTNPLLIKIDD